ncbi:sensor histidine kinase [Phycisphaerales bacterium AB-hyl4]|uniref:histidine kinase n=1 Tax=Natronomicrosphaera hydrolytica TaxID=3242702 RepID=A0ABV4U4W0_9BACT
MTGSTNNSLLAGVAGGRMEDLAEIIQAYNTVTDKLQHSHERLQSEVLRLRRELASTNAQLQRSKRLSALGEMAAGIAHEIRNPLAAIQLYATMVIDDLDVEGELRPDVAAENAHKIASAVRGLNGIVMDVLSFAREIQPRPARLRVSEVFERVIDAHRPAIEAGGVAVTCGDDADEPIELDADPELLHQALLNLVRNAVDAMADREPRVLTLDASEDEAGVVLTVRDTGPGIDRDDIDRIFNPFFTTRNTGTGLGLAIVHRIVDAHAGSIAVHNDEVNGGGAVFQLTLPAEAEAAASGPPTAAREDAA